MVLHSDPRGVVAVSPARPENLRPVFYAHWSQIPTSTWTARYFQPKEFADRSNGSLLLDYQFVDRCDRLRSRCGFSLRINSSYRSRRHNALVGGSPLSRHRFAQAADFSIIDRDAELIHRLALELGFNGIGKYQTFIHVDTRERSASWDFSQR